ncbi:MAG: 2-oxo acid dehydrogenase subunit E2 [Holophagae bacterium]|jgi:pyruvate dehydrogenase E2 component (dihydrolipoamide acetyltransferase)
MGITINLPELGEGVDSVDVVAVLVSVGDRIEKDQPLIEVETEKASVEVPSTAAGTVAEVHVSEGDTLGENAPLVTLDEGEASGAESEPAPEPEDDEQPGDRPSAEAASSGQPEEDAGPAEEPSSGGAEEQRGGGAEEHEDRGAAARRTEAADERLAPRTPADDATPRKDLAVIPAAPTVRRFAREVGVDLTTVKGSGPGGRISIDDVKAHANRLLSERPSQAGVPLAAAELPDLSRFGPVRREPMTKVRRLTAENLSRAWLTAPQVTNHESADITDLEAFRQAYKGRVEQAGGKLTMTAILVKIVASTLKRHPTLNAAVDMANHEIVYRDSIHIGVAVDTERGLLVPVIRDADRKDLTELGVELDDLARRARDKKLTPDEMQGGTFSISNLGGIGGTGFSPIVNWPEVAILGVSRGRTEPRWDGSSFRPRLMLPLSLSYDHRLVDGADAAHFLARLKDALEQPLLLALGG